MLSSKKCSFIYNLVDHLNFITWALKNWCFWNVVLGKTLESLLDSKEIKPVNLKGNQPWIFIGMDDADAKAPILWSPGAKSQLTGKVCLLQISEVQHVNPNTEPLNIPLTNWRTIIPKYLLHCHKSSRAHDRFLNLGIQQRDWEPPGNLTLKVRGIWLQNFHRIQETDSWRAQTKLVSTKIQEKGALTPQETEPDLPVSVQEYLVEMWVDSGLPQGQRHKLQQSWEPQYMLA